MMFGGLLSYIKASCFLSLHGKFSHSQQQLVQNSNCAVMLDSSTDFPRTTEKAELLIAICVPRLIQLATMVMSVPNCVLTV